MGSFCRGGFGTPGVREANAIWSPALTFRMKSHDMVGSVLFASVGILMAARLPIGLDLSDEAYYAIFLDNWLKGGIAMSTLLTLHQTAALLLYPLARIHVALVGSSDGLLLVLRTVFLVGEVAAAALWVCFLRRLGVGVGAWCIGAAIIAFVPFGLPAPSYNSIGLQGLLIATAALGLAALWEYRLGRTIAVTASAVASAVCSVAYPPLTLPVGLLAVLVIVLSAAPRPWMFLFATLAAGLVAWSAVVVVLTPQRLWDSAIYLSEINDPGGFGKKLSFSAGLLGQHPLFVLICLAAIALGLGRRKLPSSLMAISLAALMLATFAYPTVLYAKAHDAVTVAALSGLALLGGLKRSAPMEDRVVAIIYATSLMAGAVTMATATFAIYNLCIGGLPAAALALVIRIEGKPAPAFALSIAPALAIMPSLLATSLLAPYGEIPSAGPREWIRQGFFSGLLAKPRDSAPVEIVQRRVEPLFGADRTLAVFGRLPGLALGSSARLKALTAFPLMPDVPEKGLARTHAFYAEPNNRPAIVLIYRDPYFSPVNPMLPDFERWYREEKRFKTALGEIEIYRRR